ncbi:signal recognition particle 9 kDa protein-domain-containing protein [Neurospora hispaniola]|uniref:Signal recognition particle 9 kDa protein-domain-containing protein n=1 Tax=Neurospora hispaniola TaxID=588809 RepID=A0AAJ0I9B1_9PEZI|nr:signal recognition particle 9 kDa protein-domain-containing protein [Neurospora hispaniola]
MPYYEKSEDWLHQSALLLQARPQTTRVTTSYSLRPAIRPSKAEKLAAKEARRAKEKETSSKKTLAAAAAASTEEEPPKDAAAAKPPRGHLVLKTFDPHSGVCLKYKTSKAAEVGRLIQMLGQLGRRMAALPVDEAKESADVVMADAAAAAAEEGAAAAAAAVSGTATPVAGASTPAPAAGGGGQGKKKKKGKR